ncbi:hypothetical protein D3C84_1168460 [compost metagenome]
MQIAGKQRRQVVEIGRRGLLDAHRQAPNGYRRSIGRRPGEPGKASSEKPAQLIVYRSNIFMKQ